MKKSQDNDTDTELIIPIRIGKHSPMTAEEAAKQSYTMYTHNRSRQRSRLSQKDGDSKTPTTDRHTSKRKEAKDE